MDAAMAGAIGTGPAWNVNLSPFARLLPTLFREQPPMAGAVRTGRAPGMSLHLV